jgi:hypothetical protein
MLLALPMFVRDIQIYRAMAEAKHKAERATHVTKWLKIYNISTLFALVNKQKQHSKV